jgi:hypothetical protein
MIVVKIELHSAVTKRVRHLYTLIISNDGTGTADRGNYDVKLGGSGQTDLRAIFTKPTRTARVTDYPRKSYHVRELMRRAFEGLK